MIYLSNAFSLQMCSENATICKERISAEDIPADSHSCVGHADTAAVLSKMLGHDVPMNRENIVLDLGDILYVAQVVGGRLPEGATTLPEGVEIRFYRITVL